MKIKNILKILTITIATSSLTLISGCQTSGRVVSTETSKVCPQCKTETVTTSIKGLKYTKHVCPSCKTTKTIDPNGSYDETGPDMLTVHVCKKCSSVVEPCPQCNKQQSNK